MKKDIVIRSSAAEYLTFVASTGSDEKSFEMRYEDENIWLTQKLMSMLYDVSLSTINEHLKNVFADGELLEKSTIRNFRIVQMRVIEKISIEKSCSCMLILGVK